MIWLSRRGLTDCVVVVVEPLRVVAQQLARQAREMQASRSPRPLGVYVCLGETDGRGPFLEENDTTDAYDNGDVTLDTASVIFLTPELLCGTSEESIAVQKLCQTSKVRLFVVDEVSVVARVRRAL